MPLRSAAAAAVAAVGAAMVLRALRDAPPGGAARWERINHAGQPVSLLEGPAYVAAAGATSLVAGPGPALAAVGAGSLGALDDLAGDSESKGLRGHLRALAEGRVTTGAVKIVGLGVTGLVAAALVDGRRRRDGEALDAIDTLVGGAVIAGSANLLNLLDLRPGRALKATVLAALALHSSPASRVAAAAAGGAALGLIRDDLSGATMLGDTGANSAGALLGAAFAQRSGRAGRWAALGVLAGLTLASERVSFTTVIESTPGLRELDALGR